MASTSILLLWLTLAQSKSTPVPDYFTTSVRPILVARCVNCHGPDVAEGGLRLDSRKALLKGGEHGQTVNLKEPGNSLLLQAVHRTKKGMEMPPSEKLSPVEVAVFERWIREGAKWPDAVVLPAPAAALARIGDAWSDKRNPIVKIFKGSRLDLWSVKPVRAVSPPARESMNPIDAFLPARGAAVDRRILLRRLSYDLIGLPPTVEEVEAFASDDSPEAETRAIDKLLASPRFGEHWGRIWLDVVRYSDSNGFDWDEYRPNAWRFRDYVIRSFNEDKPFDRLVKEHLAGDETFSGPPKSATERDALIGAGFLRLGPQDNSAGGFNEQDRARAELLTDLVETTGSAFLGMTFSCCRCHDHKHDPLSQADYYRFRAFFEGVKYGDGVSIDLADEQDRKRREIETIDRKIADLVKSKGAATKEVRERLRNEKIKKLSAEDRKLVELSKAKTPDADKKKRDKLRKSIVPTDAEIAAALAEPAKKQVQELQTRIDVLQKTKPALALALLMIDGEGNPPPTHVLGAGDHKSPKEAVVPGVPSMFDPNPLPIARTINAKSTGRRTALANWIASPKNPLTARVFVNRVWQGVFGAGLVKTPDDFGLAGSKPNHAELLDWLAGEFVRQGWSVKTLIRLVVTSTAYREAAADGNPRMRRLSAEQLRDSMLAVSGLLHPKNGGEPSWPELPAEVLQANPAFLDDNAEKTKSWYPSPLAEQFCRSIFLIQKRTVRVPFLETFDLPENAACCGKRSVSIVAPQALSLMNSPLATSASRAFAERIRQEVGDDPTHQIMAVFRLALQRSPTKDEAAACRSFLMGRRLDELCRAMFNLNEFAFLD